MRAIVALLLAFALCWCPARAAADELAPPAVRNPAGGTITLPVTGDATARGDSADRAPVRGITMAYAAADAARPIRRQRSAPRDIYHPSVPMGETRSAWTAPAVSPTPFALTAGEAMTPLRGRVALNITRISDERDLVDIPGRAWNSDGEVRAVSLEVVSPRHILRLGSVRVPVHASASIHAYTSERALFDELRNVVEEELLGAGQSILDNHDTGGREHSIGGEDLLGTTPLWKLRFGVKVPLPRVRLGCYHLLTSVSAGLTLPAFGANTEAGNEDVQPDFTLAYALPFSRKLWLTGAATVSLPGSTERFDELGVDTSDVLFGWNGNLEYWFNPCWAVALGLQYQTSYIDGTGLAMDEDSTFFNIGILWRPHPRHTIHLVWSENPQTGIGFGAERDHDGAQKDADFTFLLGWRYSL